MKFEIYFCIHLKTQILSIEAFLKSSIPIFIWSVPMIIFLIKFMFVVLSWFRVSLVIFRQYPISDKSSLHWCKFCSFCFTAVFNEFVIVGKSFIIKMNSSGPRTDP